MSWAELTLSNFDKDSLHLLSPSYPPLFFFSPSLYRPFILFLLETGIIGAHFMLRHSLNFVFFFFFLKHHYFLNIVITTVCLKDQVRVIKYAKANCIFAQVSFLEIFHQGTLLFFPNVVMNFKVDLYYWRRGVCDQNTEQSPDWNSLFLEHWKGDCCCQQER